MYKGKTYLAIIPARGGSKRLPDKNILNLSGKPLIAWTIEAALGSNYIDRVVVSTDDQKIANISKKYGADVPFMRPDELATDVATSVDVVLHSLDEVEANDKKYDYVILLQPTSPLRTWKNIDKSINILQSKKSDAVISVCEVDHNPLWANSIPEDGDLSNFLDKSIVNKRSQDLEHCYRINGAIYICDIDRLKVNKNFFLTSNCIAYKMKRSESIDIDIDIDMNLASLYLSNEKDGI
jgi:CMP-N,N'-diacetyllegionaminic acid synthase